MNPMPVTAPANAFGAADSEQPDDRGPEPDQGKCAVTGRGTRS